MHYIIYTQSFPQKLSLKAFSGQFIPKENKKGIPGEYS